VCRSRRERADTLGGRISGGVVQQHAADLAARGPRMHRHLLDVQAAVHDAGDQVSGRDIGVNGRDPGAAILPVPGEFLNGQRFVVGDLRHADLTEQASRGPLDFLHYRKVALSCCPDMHQPQYPAHLEPRPPADRGLKRPRPAA
jgi:hypothetical protein